eukprot:4490258-Heterocapsa_arctica.AAC.1
MFQIISPVGTIGQRTIGKEDLTNIQTERRTHNNLAWSKADILNMRELVTRKEGKIAEPNNSYKDTQHYLMIHDTRDNTKGQTKYQNSLDYSINKDR